MPAEVIYKYIDKRPECMVVFWIMSVQYRQHVNHPDSMAQYQQDNKENLEEACPVTTRKP